MLHGVISKHGPRDAAHVVSEDTQLPRRATQIVGGNADGVVCALLLLLALVFGGGTRPDLFSDLIVQLAAVPAIIFALARGRLAQLIDLQRSWVLLISLVVVVPLIFLLPLPIAVWQGLPGRAELLDAQRVAGLSHGYLRALSLDTTATWAALRALLPGIAIALLAPQLDDRWRRRLLMLVVLGAVFTVPLGLAQLNGGAISPLRFYVPTNVLDAVGLFANRNHFAALLVSSLLLTAGFLLEELSDKRAVAARFRLRALIFVLIGCVLLFGLALSRSRAGLGLAGLGLIGVAILGWRIAGRRMLPWIIGGAFLALILVFQVGFVWIIERIGQLFAGDHRWLILSASLDLARDFAWVGVGPGGFPAAYAAFEPITAVGAKIVNHAHNDWLEWWIEAGFVLPLVALAFAMWLRSSSVILFNAIAAKAPDQLYRQGAWLAVIVGILHAGFDYQLRSTTNLCVFVLCCACLVQRPPSRAHVPKARPRLHAVPAIAASDDV